MEVISLCPLPVAPLVWQLQPSRWVLTVVTKATFRLEPGVVSLAPSPEPILDEDSHWDDDPARSVVAPADLVPFKLRADVVLVGSAHARNGQPVRSLVARMSVGRIDKSIEVVCPRIRTQSGEVREGKRWTRMSLSYERAAGGPDTDNPVGVSPAGPRDPYGQLPLPSLQPPGFSLQGDRLPPPVGFGPVAASWPARRSKLGRGAPEGREWARTPFGEGFDPAYFQVAPADQQLDAIRVDERFTLENMHPRHPLLVTSLPGTRPRARIELSGAAPREIALSPDTLWIDTDRAICTVTYRAKVDVEHPDQQGRVLVAITKGDQAVPWAKLAPPAAPLSSPPPPPAAPVSASAILVPSAPPSAARVPPAPLSGGRPAASSGGKASGPAGGKVAVSSGGKVAVSPGERPGAPKGEAPLVRWGQMADTADEEPPDSEVDVEITLTESPAELLDRTGPLRAITRPVSAISGDPAALPFQPAPPGWQSPAASPSRPGLAAPPGPVADWTATPAFGAPAGPPVTLSAAGSAPPVFGLPPEPPPVAPPPLLTSPAWAPLSASASAAPLPPAPVPPPLLAAPPSDGAFGLLEASNAAARVLESGARSESRPPPEPAPRAEAEHRQSVPAPEGVAVELVWLDIAAGPLLAQHPVFARQRAFVDKAPADKAPADKAPADKAPADKAAGGAPDAAALELITRAHAYEVLSRCAPSALGALESAIEAAEEESPPSPALVLVTGTLELCLDEVKMLEAVVAAASPLASSDKKLKETLDVATEALKSPMLGMPDFAQGLSARIRDAWTKANRLLPPDHLAACTERLLLEQRSYQRRELLDDTWIRALLSGAAGEAPVPTYLPARIAKRLPLYRRFPARVLGEVVWQQDQYETCPVALRVLALGRLPPRTRLRGARERSPELTRKQ